MECKCCPRGCKADRDRFTGFCGLKNELRIAKIMVHRGEEPVLTGDGGSGAVFFSGCVLKCKFCQNYIISHGNKGEIYTPEMLISAILKLQDEGVSNINLITPTHFIEQLIPILKELKPLLKIPIVYNTGGYELPEQIKKLEGLVDIYLPDLKYYSNELGIKYSSVKDYFYYTSNSIKEMIRQQPKVVIENGLMKNGVIVRHLVLPSHYKDSLKLMEWLSSLETKPLVSVMRQYTPAYDAVNFPEINRRLTTFEYDKVVNFCADLGLDGFTQMKGCDNLDMTPNF